MCQQFIYTNLADGSTDPGCFAPPSDRQTFLEGVSSVRRRKSCKPACSEEFTLVCGINV